MTLTTPPKVGFKQSSIEHGIDYIASGTYDPDLHCAYIEDRLTQPCGRKGAWAIHTTLHVPDGTGAGTYERGPWRLFDGQQMAVCRQHLNPSHSGLLVVYYFDSDVNDLVRDVYDDVAEMLMDKS